MNFDLKKPCKNCPFANTKHRIKFACKERAEEIEETAYRQGFVCHKHGTTVEHEEGDHIDFAPDGSGQHCAGAILMYLKSGCTGNIPFENLSEEEQARVEENLDWSAPVFESEEAFITANS